LRQSLLNQQERATLEIHLHTDAAALANLRLLEALRADGVAICLADQLVLQGSTPGESAVRQLVLWLGEQPGYRYASDCLGADYPPADTWGDTAAGIMAIRPTPGTTLVWFRKEYRQTINWAGNPDKPAADAQGEIHPRRSFALWRQLTRGQSCPWLDCERDYVQQLHEFLAEVLQHRLELCSRLAGKPRAIGPTELENFLYSAAHDLSEPLRGIKNYTQLIQLQEKQALSNRNGGRLDSVLRLAERMEDNLHALLNLAVAGETTLTLRLHSLQALVQEVADMMTALFSQRALRIEIVSDLPEMRCDAAKVTSIYQNLIQNAIKYNESAIASIRIGHYLMQNRPVFFVKDNGIGIPAQYHSTIFQLFRRLHDGTRYGGGSGAGMSIIKKAVQSHGGHIWLESAPGEGSSFYFTLEPTVRS
jgi:light-regulated signal transduction histidine kinase (bacteriophytochrome)